MTGDVGSDWLAHIFSQRDASPHPTVRTRVTAPSLRKLAGLQGQAGSYVGACGLGLLRHHPKVRI